MASVCAPNDQASPPSGLQAAAVETLFAERIAVRLEALGYASVSAFAAMRPTASLDVLAATLGLAEVTSFHLERQLLAEGLRDGRGDAAARDLLVRLIHECLPGGWPAVGDATEAEGVGAVWRCRSSRRGGCWRSARRPGGARPRTASRSRSIAAPRFRRAGCRATATIRCWSSTSRATGASASASRAAVCARRK